jgi:hypothetical protein
VEALDILLRDAPHPGFHLDQTGRQLRHIGAELRAAQRLSHDLLASLIHTVQLETVFSRSMPGLASVWMSA